MKYDCLSGCRLASKIRSQSPGNAHQYHYSPTRLRPNLSNEDRKADDKKVEKHREQSKDEEVERKITNNNIISPPPQAEKNVVNADIAKPRSPKGEAFDKRLKGDASERNQSPDRKILLSPKVEKKVQSNTQDGDKTKGEAHTNDSFCSLTL